MKKMVLWIAVLAFAVAGAQEKPVRDSQSQVRSLGWLVGGTWKAEASKDLTIKTTYSWSDNEAFLRFKTHFVSPQADAHRYDGQFYWDPEAKRLTMWYMDAENAIYSGPITANGEVTTFAFRGEDFAGKMADLRVNVTRRSNELYHWQLTEKAGDDWKEIAALDFKRSTD